MRRRTRYLFGAVILAMIGSLLPPRPLEPPAARAEPMPRGQQTPVVEQAPKPIRSVRHRPRQTAKYQDLGTFDSGYKTTSQANSWFMSLGDDQHHRHLDQLECQDRPLRFSRGGRRHLWLWV
jgi:hypothetical protein